MTDTVREELGLDWTWAEERALSWLGRMVDAGMRWLPERVRWHETAFAALYPTRRRKGRLANVASVAVAGVILTLAGLLSKVMEGRTP